MIGPTKTAKRRLFLTEDRKRIVPESAAAAATLYAAPGDFIPDAAVKQFELKEGVDFEESEPAGAEKPANGKAAPQAPNKARSFGAGK